VRLLRRLAVLSTPISIISASLALLVPVTAVADTTSEGQFVSDTNHARAQRALHHYAVPSDLTSVARRWAQYMARHHTLEHNPNYTRQICCWSAAGENVGVGSSVGQIQRAFMNSSPHRANILSRSFTQVGIGTARSSDGRLYVDEVFRRPSHSSAAAAPVAAPAPPRSAPVTGPVRASRSTTRRPLSAAPAAPAVTRRPPALRRPTASAELAAHLAMARRVPATAADPVEAAVAYAKLVESLT